MTDKLEGEAANLSDLNVFAVSTDPDGATLPIHCPNCKKLLTKILLNNRCTIDIMVECRSCGGVARGNDLYAEPHGKVQI